MDTIARLREIDEDDTPVNPAPIESPINQQIAVVVGIDVYAAGLRPLDNAVRDARSVADVLQLQYGFMIWPDSNPLLDTAASSDAVRRCISESLAYGTETTRWLFYFAGHGLVVGQRDGYLLPADVRRDDLSKALLVRDLLLWCLDSRCGEVLIILDACYSGHALIQPAHLSDRFAETPDNRICQIITSGNPDQPVLDGDGGSTGHSVFTQALLDALEGWSGVHEPDGSIRFIPLLDYLVLEVPRRLRAQGRGYFFQQPVGGSLRGHRQMRSVTLRSIVPRLDPISIRDVRSERPERRIRGLEQIAAVEKVLQPTAVNLAVRHLQRTELAPARPLFGWTQRFEPDPAVRTQAAHALGSLGDPAALDALIAALDDVAPVRLAAAAALGTFGDQRAAPALLRTLQHAHDEEFLPLSGAIAALGANDAILDLLRIALQQGKLVPFLGPNLPKAWTGRTGRMRLALELARVSRMPATQSLAEAAAGAWAPMQSHDTYMQFLLAHFDQVRPSKTPFHDALTQLGCKLLLAWNYDPQWTDILGMNTTVTGRDAVYAQPEESTIVYLSGTMRNIDNIAILAEDYVQLRAQEVDRVELVAFLQRRLQDHVVLFLGHNPQDPDFSLLVQHVLNGHLKDIRIQPILVAETQVPASRWGRFTIWPLRANDFHVVEQLGQAHPRSK